ncbi:MAG TPA: ATP-binding protein [Candidatus Omnitrophota bacterium]|nr:ATP-binding protein [Candidatus Omnitrophota bacterium]HPS37472.1 ATP-binding protein [Candidatus Omnitrophota bacterium]
MDALQIFLIVLVLSIIFLIFQAFGVLRRKREIEVSPEAVPQATFADKLAKEVEEHIEGDTQQASVLTQKLSAIVTKEVEKKTMEKTTELRERFERVIEEKNKTLDIAVNKVKIVTEKFEKLDTSFKELGEEKKQTEEVVHSMAEGVIMVNKKGEIMLMNPAAEKLLGVKKEEKIGQSILSDLKEEQLVSLVQQPADGAKSKEIVIQSQNDQVKKVLLASNAVIESEDGKTVGFVSVISDVTKQREIETLKNEFLANVSHDLRTPLTCIQGSLQLLADTSAGNFLTPGQGKNVATALRNIERLSRLINDLLDLSKLESKKFTMRPTLFHAEDLVQTLVNEFAAWSKTKGITIHTELEKPLEIEADQDRISQVLTNLIGNALKFTPNGGTVTVVGKRKADAQKIELGIRDTGPGIAEKDFAKLFEKFSRIESQAMQGVSGTGLGLTISREIVELHGGRIWVESEEGKGSYFAFELPLKTASADASQG